MGGIKDKLSPPCQNMGGYITPFPPRDLRPCQKLIMEFQTFNNIFPNSKVSKLQSAMDVLQRNLNTSMSMVYKIIDLNI